MVEPLVWLGLLEYRLETRIGRSSAISTDDTAVRSLRQIRWRVGFAWFAVSPSPMSSMKIGGTNLTAICSDPLHPDPD
jgi:hypothetical protein